MRRKSYYRDRRVKLWKHWKTSSQRQHRLRSLQCLDLRLLIYAEHDRMIRWIQVQTHNVLHLIHKEGIVGNLEMAVAMGLQVEQLGCTVDLEMPVCSARVRTLQWVPLAGGPCNTVLITSATRWLSWVARPRVFHRLLNVVDGDVIPEDRLGVAVAPGDGRSREGKESCLRQGVP